MPQFRDPVGDGLKVKAIKNCVVNRFKKADRLPNSIRWSKTPNNFVSCNHDLQYMNGFWFCIRICFVCTHNPAPLLPSRRRRRRRRHRLTTPEATPSK